MLIARYRKKRSAFPFAIIPTKLLALLLPGSFIIDIGRPKHLVQLVARRRSVPMPEVGDLLVLALLIEPMELLSSFINGEGRQYAGTRCGRQECEC
ncbi:hypothetical protein [Pseudomonas sp. Marseille-QA0892]